MKTSLIFIALTALGLRGAAQEAPSDTILTLEQCQEMAVHYNASLRSADNNTKMAKELREEAFTKYFPEISASGVGFMANHGMAQYDVDLPLLQEMGIGPFSLSLVKKGKAAGVQALQPVFMGGRIVNGNRLAEIGETVAKLQRNQTENEVRLTTEKYYWQLATLKSTRHTLLSAIEMLDTLSSQVNVAVEAGVAMRNDLLKVDLKLNEYRASLVDLDNGIKLCRMLLSQYIGADFMKPINIDAVVPETIPKTPREIYVNPGEALPETVLYRLLESNVKAKNLAVKLEKGNNLPQVAVGAGWYYHDILEQNHNFGALQLVVNIPISTWWGGSHAIKRKRLELENAKTELTDKSELLQLNMQNKWDEVTAAHRKMEIARQSIAQSAENLRLNRLYYEAGTVTITDLLEAQTLYRESQDNYSASYGNFRCALAEYKFAIQ